MGKKAESNSPTMNVNLMMTGDFSPAFPPCTSEECTVDIKEKERVATASASRPQCSMTEKCVDSCAAYGRICPCAARIAAHAACDAIHELKENSQIFPSSPEDEENQCSGAGKPTYLNAEDIVIGKKLGEGGFSNVNLCTVKIGDEAGQQFAVKYLKRRAMVDLHQFKHGASDLAIEAFFLQALDHPNIVKLHGVTAGSVETNVASGKECGFFIVVDRLTHTLEQLIEQWRKEQENTSNNIMTRFSAEYKNRKKAELHERIKIALSIADAMAYLHDTVNVIFRDLKPDNCGFDENGVLKLFDFGLAKELKPGLERANGKYKLTGNTGSRRYMAPEVAKESPYDKSVDVYSFGILLWELCSAEKPFHGYSSAKHMQQVVIGGERPKMDAQHTAQWPANLQWLMNCCWSPFPSVRPTFSTIQGVLRDILDGKESIPQSLVVTSPHRDKVRTDPPAGGFGGLFQPLSRRKARSETIPGDRTPPKEGYKGLKPPAKGSGRSRSWGFTLGK